MLVTVIYARKWDYTKDNKRVSGCELTYIAVTPVASAPRGRDQEKGAQPTTLKGDVSLFDRLRDVPGKYELEIAQLTDYKQNPYLRIVDVTPAAGVNGVAPSNLATATAGR